MNLRRPHRLIIVDDDARIRELLQRYLQQEGFEVLLAENGERLDRLLQRETPDLIVLDLMLQFVIDRGRDEALVAVARLHLAGLEIDAGNLESAQRVLDTRVPEAMRPWWADRRGDLLQRQGQTDAARSAYLEAWRGMDGALGYRAIVEAKLNALGVDPTAEPEAKP